MKAENGIMSVKNILKKKWVRVVFSLFITGAALWLCFRKIDWEVLRESLSRVHFFWVIVALFNVILSVFALGVRWQILLKPEARISLGRLFRFNIISQYTNIVFPARFGEVVRAYLVSKQYEVPAGYALGTVFIEKFFDFFVFLSLWIFIPTVFAIEQQVKGHLAALFLCVLTAFFMIFIILKPDMFLWLLRKVSGLFPKKYRDKVSDFFESGTESFQLLKNPKVFALVLVLSLGFVVAQALTNFFLFKAFDLELSFWVGLVVLLAIQVGNIPPSVPGKLGIFEYVVVLALSIFGISKGLALSYAIMLHLVAFLPKLLLGQIYLLKTGKAGKA